MVDILLAKTFENAERANQYLVWSIIITNTLKRNPYVHLLVFHWIVLTMYYVALQEQHRLEKEKREKEEREGREKQERERLEKVKREQRKNKEREHLEKVKL